MNVEHFKAERMLTAWKTRALKVTSEPMYSLQMDINNRRMLEHIYMYLRTDIHSHCIIWFNVNTSPAVWMSLDARSIDQTRSQTNAPPQPDARYVVSSKQADGVFVMVDIRAETGSLESGGYRSGMYMYVSGVLKECEAFFKEERFFADPDHQKTPLAATGVAKNLGHPMAPFLYTVSLQLVTTERGDWWRLRCRVLSCFNLGSLSLFCNGQDRLSESVIRTS